MAPKTHKITVNVEVTLTPQDIDDIMVAALEGGINYWCRKAEVVGKYMGEYASDQISRGGALNLHDAEENKIYELTLEKFLKGVKLYLEEGNHVLVEDGRLDTGDIDGAAADCIVQFALFDEVIYG